MYTSFNPCLLVSEFSVYYSLSIVASVFSISNVSSAFSVVCVLLNLNHPIFHSRPVCYLYVLQYAMYMLLRSFEPPNLTFPASMLSIRIASMPFTCCFEASNHPIFHSRPVCYLYVLQYAMYMLLRSFEQNYHPFLASMISIRIASIPCTCSFEASNHPIFHSRPVCYLYVLPMCHVHAASKLRTTQSSTPGQYAIYTYCQYAIYMLLRSFEPPNLPFPASTLYSCMPFTCCFEASNHPIFHSRPVCYLYVLQYAIYMLLRSFEPPNLPFPASMLSIRTPVCHLHAASKLRTTQSSIPGLYAIYTYSSMPFTCCFEASNHPIFHSRPVCYLYVLQYAIYMLHRSFEPPNLPFPASYTYSSMPFTCCFEASNHPIFHSRPVCYLYVLPVCQLHAASKLRTTQSSIPGKYAIYTYSSMPFTCCFEASNNPIFHSRPVCYLYVLQYAIYMLL